MGYHFAPLSGFDVQGKLPLPQPMVDAWAYMGPQVAPLGGQLLSGARTALMSGKVPALSVESAAQAVATAVVAGGCAAGSAAAGPLAPAVVAGCGWLGQKMRGDLGFVIEAPKAQINPAAFYNRLIDQGKAGCAAGDAGCRAEVKATADWLCIGETSPLRVYNLWAGNHCKTCATSWWSGDVDCKLAEDPGCHVNVPWAPSAAAAQAKISEAITRSQMAAEARFTAASVAAAQSVKPAILPLCGGASNCTGYADAQVDLMAMDVAEKMRREGPVPAADAWRTHLTSLTEDLQNRAENARVAQEALASAARAESAAVVAKNKARVAAQNAKAQAYLQDVFAGQAAEDKAQRRMRVVGLAVLATAAGAAYLWTKRRTGR